MYRIIFSGNIMVVGAVISDKRLWKEGNIFIVNLAIADLCVTGKNIQCLLYSNHNVALFRFKKSFKLLKKINRAKLFPFQ